MRLINADAIMHVTIYDEEHEEHTVKEMTAEDMLDTYSNEGCPTIMPESMFYGKSEPRWIPVSERLPDKPNIYTVTDHKGDVVRYVYDNNESSKKYWKRCAKAWMPLPEPYKAKSEKKMMQDQSAKADAGKPDLTLVPRQIIWDIAQVRAYGNRKYGDPDNWKDVKPERYRAAAFRHFLAYLDDPKGVDEESGIEHYKHLACNLAFLCAMEAEQHGY